MKGRRCEAGSSLIESLLLGIVVLLPLAYMVVELGMIQRTSIGISAAAREAGRSFVTARTPAEAVARAEHAAHTVMAIHRLDPGRASVRVSGDLRRGSDVEVEVSYLTPAVPVPLLAEIPGMRLRSRHVEQVDKYRSIDR